LVEPIKQSKLTNLGWLVATLSRGIKEKDKKETNVKATTPEIEEEEEEDIKEDISESESDCIIVASSRSRSK
jgi:fructose-1-phosphate kinase PfkB-like protein